MPMSAERVVELCNASIGAIQEDIALLEEGALEWRAPTQLNVTRHQLFRMRAVISHLQEIVDGCGCDCS